MPGTARRSRTTPSGAPAVPRRGGGAGRRARRPARGRLPCPIVTGSGTGTHDFDHEPGVFTELQVGSYIFSDVIYDRVAMTPDGAKRWRNSLFVQTRIVSDQHPGFATSDAGSKSFTMDGPAPVIASRRAGRLRVYDRFGDEFGKVVLADPQARLAGRHAAHLHRPALRPERELVRLLSLRARRPPGRSLADRGARRLLHGGRRHDDRARRGWPGVAHDPRRACRPDAGRSQRPHRPRRLHPVQGRERPALADLRQARPAQRGAGGRHRRVLRRRSASCRTRMQRAGRPPAAASPGAARGCW